MEIIEFTESNDQILFTGDNEFFRFVKPKDIYEIRFTGTNIKFFDSKTQEYVFIKIPENDAEIERFFYILKNHERKKDLLLYMVLLDKMKKTNYKPQRFLIFRTQE